VGIYHYKYREYSIRLRRFIQRDPVEGGFLWNEYNYCRCNPISRIDPLGLRSLAIVSIFVGGLSSTGGFFNQLGTTMKLSMTRKAAFKAISDDVEKNGCVDTLTFDGHGTGGSGGGVALGPNGTEKMDPGTMTSDEKDAICEAVCDGGTVVFAGCKTADTPGEQQSHQGMADHCGRGIKSMGTHFDYTLTLWKRGVFRKDYYRWAMMDDYGLVFLSWGISWPPMHRKHWWVSKAGKWRKGQKSIKETPPPPPPPEYSPLDELSAAIDEALKAIHNLAGGGIPKSMGFK